VNRRSLLLLAAIAAGFAYPAAAPLVLAQPAKLDAETAPDLTLYRDAITRAQGQVRAAREKLDAAERELRYQRHRKRPRGEAAGDIDAAKGELAAAETELARAVDEGRRAGLLPGDLRALGVEE
jgi:hypothetical protein